MLPGDWARSPHCGLGALIAVGEDGAPPTERLLLIWHAGRGHARFTLPAGHWALHLDSARAFVAAGPAAAEPVRGHNIDLHEARVCLLVQSLQGGGQATHTSP
jgi:glycogen operon protein